MDKMTWYWTDLWTGKNYWESEGITYLVYVEDGYLKLRVVEVPTF